MILKLMLAPVLKWMIVNHVPPLFQQLLENMRAAMELYEQMKFFYMFYRETNQSKLNCFFIDLLIQNIFVKFLC